MAFLWTLGRALELLVILRVPIMNSHTYVIAFIWFLGHFEIPPFSEDAKRSAYHIRNLEIFRLKQISSPFDIVFSHEWPQGIYNEQYGDKERLLRFKKHLREDVENERLGCRALKEILMQQQPKYWFAAHLHVKYCRDFKMSQMYRHPVNFLFEKFHNVHKPLLQKIIKPLLQN